MNIRGNYHFMYASQLLTGLITYPLAVRFGIPGILLGFIPFLVGMLVVLIKHEPDEREMALTYKISSYESICAGVIAGILYFSFPQVIWFFALISAVSVARGIIGMIVFTVK